MTILLRDHVALACAATKMRSCAEKMERFAELHGEKTEEHNYSENPSFPKPPPQKAPFRPFFHDDPALHKELSADMERRRRCRENSDKVCRLIQRDDDDKIVRDTVIEPSRNLPILPMSPEEQERFIKIREANRNVVSESMQRANAERRAKRIAKAEAHRAEEFEMLARAYHKALNPE